VEAIFPLRAGWTAPASHKN